MKEVEDIAGVAMNYFENLFKVGTCERMEDCLNTIIPKISLDM